MTSGQWAVVGGQWPVVRQVGVAMRIVRILVIALASAAGLCNLPALFDGAVRVTDWVRIHTSSVPYFGYPYAITGFAWLALSMTGIAAAGIAIRKRGSYGIALALVSLALGLASALILPNVEVKGEMGLASQDLLGHADQSLAEWDRK